MSDSSPAAFTPERRRTLQAVVERILPGTDGPGAAETAVVVGFERAVQHRSLRGLRPGIDKILDLLESQAGAMHERGFSACAPDAQDDLLRALEDDQNPMIRFLFRCLIEFSVEALLGDPVHGGNRDSLGWKAIGLETEHVRAGMCLEAREG